MTDARELVKPLACPFCGHPPRFNAAQVLIDSDCPESICCSNEECPVQPETDYLPISDAITAWNTRAALGEQSNAD